MTTDVDAYELEQQVVEHFEQAEKDLETLYRESPLQYGPDEEAIKTVLIQCLEMHFGSLDKVIHTKKDVQSLIANIDRMLMQYR